VPGPIELTFLHDGGQLAASTLDRLCTFIDGARTSLDVAIYDAHLDDDDCDRLIATLDAAEARGVRVRAIYNDDHRDRPAALSPPASPPAGPSLLARLAASVPATAIPGIPDLMHNKYMIRDGETVWTGSTNWTADAWTHMENVIVVIPSADLATAFTQDFEQLWERRHVEHTGTFDDAPAHLDHNGAPLAVRAIFSPGRGRILGQLVARRIAEANRRLRICSPVITSGPILSTLAERLDDTSFDAKITVDRPQMEQALQQWGKDQRANWKIPLVQRIRASSRVAEKPSRPYLAGPPHDYMHAKIVVCDDITFMGSYNLSHSGELNAENVIEVVSAPFADTCAEFCERVYARYS
jgi:phosphatidylserine/phosphatidylglycerophosphate/cardiolipin synthase-like enzyme